jgi:Flp pilus assembly protein TadD
LVIDTDWGLAGAAYYYRKAGDTARCRDLLERITTLAARRPVSPSSLAVVRLAAGDRAGALDALEEAARAQDRLIMLNLTRLGSLRGEPRFEAVSRTVYGDRPRPVFPY